MGVGRQQMSMYYYRGPVPRDPRLLLRGNLSMWLSSESIRTTLVLICPSRKWPYQAQIPHDEEGSDVFWEPFVSRDHHCENKENNTEEVAYARYCIFHTLHWAREIEEADAVGQRNMWPERSRDTSSEKPSRYEKLDRHLNTSISKAGGKKKQWRN